MTHRHLPCWMTRVAAAALVSLCATNVGVGQLPIGRLNTVFPAGGQRGATFSVRLINFADLDEPQTMWFSHPGIRAVPVKSSIEGSTEFQVSIDPGVPDGWYEVRAGGLFGLSNPRGFLVGSNPEIAEAEPNNAARKANAIAINSTANGTIDGRGDVDWFRFQGTAGQRVLIECHARAIDSRLTPVVEIFDSKNKRVARARDLGVGDPLCDVTLANDSDHFVRVSDGAFRGSSENVYRLAVHTRPHIDFVLPSAIQPGTQQAVTVYGRNLPGGEDSGTKLGDRVLQRVRSTVIAPTRGDTLDVARRISSTESDIDGFSWRVPGSAAVMLQLAAAKPLLESEPNDDATNALTVAIPADITGQFQSPGDVDLVRFEADAKQVVMIEAFGERNGTTADPYIEVFQVKTDAKGVETMARHAANDDIATNIGGNDFLTANADAAVRFVCPQAGTYQVAIRDRYSDSRGDPSLLYRLVIRKPRPDFRAVALPGKPGNAAGQPYDPGSICVRRGGTCELPILVHRRDGHASAIQMRAENLPSGVTARPIVLSTGQSRGTLVLQAAPDAPIANSSMRVVAESDGVRRVARAATLVRRGGAASESRMSQDLVLSVLKGNAPLRITTKTAELHANQSQQLLVPIELARSNGFDQDVAVTFEGLPKDVLFENKPVKKGQSAGTFRFFVTGKVVTGSYTILPRGAATIPFTRNPWRLERQQAARDEVATAESVAKKAVDAAKASVASATATVSSLKSNNATAVTTVAAMTKQLADLSQSIAAGQARQKVASTTLAALRKQLTARQAAAAAIVRAISTSGPGAELAEQKTAADKLVADTGSAMKVTEGSIAQQRAAVAAATKKQSELTAARERAKAEIAAYPGQLAAAEKLLAEAASKMKVAEAKLVAATRTREAADKRLAALKARTKPQNIKVYEPATPITLHIAAAPLTLKVDAAKVTKIKAGQAGELTATITGETKSPVTFSLIALNLPPGIVAPPVQLPANASSGKLRVNVAPNTPPGALTYACLRATVRKDGRTFHIDTPVKIEVVKIEVVK